MVLEVEIVVEEVLVEEKEDRSAGTEVVVAEDSVEIVVEEVLVVIDQALVEIVEAVEADLVGQEDHHSEVDLQVADSVEVQDVIMEEEMIIVADRKVDHISQQAD